MENYKCIDCRSVFNGNELDSDMLFCPSCGSRLEEGSFQKAEGPKNNAYKYQRYENNYHKKSESSHKEQECFTFSCLSCGKSLRITFPFQSLSFRCGNCSGVYDIQSVNSRRSIYLVVPKISHKTSTPPPRQPSMPEEVKKAFLIFELNVNASFSEVKVKYRRCMTEYHPDKVAHLGADLKKLAEAKSKEYNAAYNVIQRYFKKINDHEY